MDTTQQSIEMSADDVNISGKKKGKKKKKKAAKKLDKNLDEG
jgi:hypothetical protein